MIRGFAVSKGHPMQTRPRKWARLGFILVAGVTALAVASCGGRESKERTLLITGMHAGERGPTQVVRVGTDGTGRKALTPNDEFCADPALSPDGKRIAFVAIHDKMSELYMMNANGSDRKRLVKNDDVEKDDTSAPSWSPDGKRIAFSTFSHNPMRGFRKPPHLYLVDADGRNLKRIEKANGMMPSWSPDGKRLLFASMEEKGPNGLCEIDVDGSNVSELLVGRALMGAWSPDGKWLAYLAVHPSQGEEAGLFLAQADGSEPKRLAGGPDDILFGVQWSADGRRIFYTRQGRMPIGAAMVYSPPAIHSIDIDGLDPRKLTTGDEPEYLGGSYFWAFMVFR